MAMVQSLRSFLLALIVGSAALLAGLLGATLRTGRIDPLDWLLPGTVAVILLLGRDALMPRAQLLSRWALVALPAGVLASLASISIPWMGLALLGTGLGLAIWGVRSSTSRGRVGRGALVLGVLGAALAAPRLIASFRSGEEASHRIVGVLSAMPLQGAAMGASYSLPALDSVGMRSPLWQALDRRLRLRPLDALEPATLRPLSVLFLAQPRLLAPQELVALDAWLRGGGRAVVLADPLLHWPDPRPLGHPARAPLTSLLDPLLGHWGLRLEPAEIDVASDPVERRALVSGGLLQLSGSSRFTRLGHGGACTLTEQGLIARCRIGAGEALLVADADWINDTLWTLAPERPADRAAWTSDALDLLAGWLDGRGPRVDPLTSWLADEARLVAAVRGALLLLLVLAVVDALVARRPSHSQRFSGTEKDQKWNKTDTISDTT
jgi:hypothetical protein